MTTTYHPAAAEVRATLTAQGFRQVNRTAGIIGSQWEKEGRKARVGHVLLSKTGQSSRGASAVWGYALSIS